MSKANKNTKIKKGGNIALVVCIILILLLSGLAGYLLLTNKDDTQNIKKRNVVVNEENVDKILTQLEKETQKVAPGYYEVNMNSTWNFANGSAVSDNAYVENADSNENAVCFDILLADTEEIIYESPILPVGSHLENITLGKDLAAGEYDCILIYYLLNENDESIGKLRVSLKINIKD